MTSSPADLPTVPTPDMTSVAIEALSARHGDDLNATELRRSSGVFRCAHCSRALFTPKALLDTGAEFPTPQFRRALDAPKKSATSDSATSSPSEPSRGTPDARLGSAVRLADDYALGMRRVAVLCGGCGLMVGNVWAQAADHKAGSEDGAAAQRRIDVHSVCLRFDGTRAPKVARGASAVALGLVFLPLWGAWVVEGGWAEHWAQWAGDKVAQWRS